MPSRHCYNCMNELIGSVKICPKCGFDNSRSNQPAQALPCGTILHGRYLIGRMLGQGGFGITYIGYDYTLEITVCIKEFFPAGVVMRHPGSTLVYWRPDPVGAAMEDGKKVLEKEARKAVKIRELDSIVKVWDVFYENETAYIVMEYINGVTLKEYLMKRARVMDINECLEVLGPVMRDLQEVHKIGIIHRDISPDNIMIREDGKVKLLDLGAAKDMTKKKEPSEEERHASQPDDPRAEKGTLKELDDPSTLVAKKGFSPPEQYTDKGEIGPWMDVYAMCATIYWCMTGKLIPDAIERSMEGDKELQFPESVPTRTASVLKHGLEMKPSKRIRDCEELLKELIPPPPPPPSKLKYMLAALAIVVVAAGIIIGSVFPQGNLEKLKKKAEKGDAAAQNDLGFAYYKGEYNGEETEQDSETAVLWFTQSAKQGFAEGQNNLGDCYFYGKGVERNYTKAAEWYTKAAEQKNAEGQVNLGECYQHGLGVEQDTEKGVELFAQAVSQGNAEGKNNLGYCYQKGIGVELDHEKALELYKEAADQGCLVAEYNLAGCYSDGWGVEQDYKKALEGYERIIEEADSLRQKDLWDSYYYGVGEDRDLEDLKAEAQGSIGYLYENDLGVGQDYTKALEWYTKAAERDNGIGLCYLGNCYWDGVVVDQDNEKAVELFTKAADQGYSDGLFMLGVYYFTAEEFRDDDKAVELFLKASEQGNNIAQVWLGYCYQEGNGVTQDYGKAVEWYTKAAALGNPEAQYYLGCCYENGNFVTQDYGRAVEWYTKAAELGNDDAKKKLEETVITGTLSKEKLTEWADRKAEEVIFLNTLDGAHADAVDLSETGDARVLGWTDGAKLYIAGQGGVRAPADSSYLFSNEEGEHLSNNYWWKLKRVTNAEYLDMSNAVNAECMFYFCNSLEYIDVSRWNTSKLKNINAMFSKCGSIKGLDVSRWDTSSVTDMGAMFVQCFSLNELDVSKWNTSNTETMSYLFRDCQGIKVLNLGGWDISSVTNMKGMFFGCTNLEELDVSGWDISGVTSKDGMFKGTIWESNPPF